MKKKIIVTGGTGYIGSHTVVELIEKGYEPIIIDNLSNSTKDSLQRIKAITGEIPCFYEIDLTNRADLLIVFKEHIDIAGVIHFAASKAVGESVKKPLLYYKNNLLSLINLLELMNQYKVSNFVFSSSCTVYGQPETLPVTEQSPIVKPESPYGNTKKVAEEVIADTINAQMIGQAILLRYFNPVGAHPSAQLGELPNGVPDNLIPYVTQTAYGLRDKLRVFGHDYATPDGTAQRDYIHIMDLARAHIVALDRMLSGKTKQAIEAFNIGTGQPYSVLDVITTFERVNGVKIPHELVPRREGDIEKIWADVDYSKTELGWQAALGLDEMMKSAWEWEKSYRAENK